MELTDGSKSLERTIADHNFDVKKIFKKGEIINGCMLNLDTAFGINSNPICNQLQIVGDKYVVFMVGSIIVVRDLSDKTETFYSYPNRFSNVTALYAVSKEQKANKPPLPCQVVKYFQSLRRLFHPRRAIEVRRRLKTKNWRKR